MISRDQSPLKKIYENRDKRKETIRAMVEIQMRFYQMDNFL
jgi:hypothetical protein